MKSKWLDRALILGPYLALSTCDKQYRKLLKHIKVKKRNAEEFVTHGFGATTHIFVKDGKLLVIVCLNDGDDLTIPQICALLAHEAVHVWQHFADSINEHNPSAEFEAYSIQSISQQLMEEYFRQKEKRHASRK